MKQLILVVLLFSAGVMLTGCSSAVFTEGVRIEKEFTVCDSVEIKLPTATDVLPESFWFKWCKKVKIVYADGSIDWQIIEIEKPGAQGVSNSEFRIQNLELQSGDSTYYKMYVADREYFIKMQETVSSKNMYIGLQWCIDLLNKYIAIEEKRLAGK